MSTTEQLDESQEDAIQEETQEMEVPPISPTARATASCGLTIIVNGRTAWPKFEFSDGALPGETSDELTQRVNNLTLDGAFDVAEKTRWLMTELHNNSKKENNSNA